MEKTMKNLQVQTKTNDVDEKGRVTVAVNRTGIEDARGDISAPGSFDATLKADIGRMKWLYNHDVTQLLGVPLEGKQIGDDIIMVGQLNMEKQLCRDVYTDYKLMAEYNRTLEHSVGVIPISRDEKDRRIVKEWKMLEYSTLSFLGANPCTFLVDLKSATPNQVKSCIQFLQNALKQPEYSDHKLKDIDMRLNLLLKSLNGGTIVKCPVCGHEFDYDEQQEYTASSQVRDALSLYVGWVMDDVVCEHVDGLRDDIRAEVLSIIDSFKGSKEDMTEKSVLALLEFVRCPHCWARVYKSDRLLSDSQKSKSAADEEEEEKPDKPDKEEQEDAEDDEEKKKSFGSFLSGIANKI